MSSSPTSPVPGTPWRLGVEQPLSRLGLGGWAFGRTGWGHQSDRDSSAALLRAIELGVNWIDTAAVYGEGHSERLIGSVLADLPEQDRPLVFTKGGVRIDPRNGSTYRDLSPASLRRECLDSMRRLGVERIDLYQLHWPVDDSAVVELAWTTLAELQREGLVRWVGVSNFDVEQLERCVLRHPVDAVQFPFSLLRRDAAGQVLPWLGERAVCGLVYSPLESGLLSGTFSERRLRELPGGDWRRSREQFQQPLVGRTLQLVERLRPIAAELGTSPAQLAVAWTLSWPGASAAIVGARNVEQIERVLGAADLSVEPEVRERIADALRDTNAGTGPAA